MLILLGLFACYLFYMYQLKRYPQCNIMTAKDTANFLQSDVDGYVKSLTQPDLHARNVSTHKEYVDVCSASAFDASHEDVATIRSAVATVHAFLLTSPDIPIPPRKLLDIPWKIAITQGRKYENGYPHTRLDVIFIDTTIMNSPDFVATLLHEKVHVFQRKYPEAMTLWLNTQGYKRYMLRSSLPLARANPDLDEWVYIDPSTKKEMVAVYNSAQPRSISDVKLSNYAFEHPFEFMAYQIGSQLKDNL